MLADDAVKIVEGRRLPRDTQMVEIAIAHTPHGCFSSNPSQSRTTVVGPTAVSPSAATTRKRCPSLEASYRFRVIPIHRSGEQLARE